MLLYGRLYFFVSLAYGLFQFLLISSYISVVPHKQIMSVFFRPFEALYTAIKSPLSLLFSRVDSFSLESLSS